MNLVLMVVRPNMKRFSTLQDKGIPLPNGRGNQLLWRCKDKVWARKPRVRAVEAIPGTNSMMPEYIAFLNEVADAFNLLDSTITEEYFTNPKTGINTDGDAIRTVAGSPSLPLSYLPSSNEELTKELRLPKDFLNPRHEQIFDTLIKLMWGSAIETNFRVPKDSSSGFPFFSSDNEQKLELFNHLLQNFDEILHLIGKKDVENLAKRHGFIIAYYETTRPQVDRPTKQRYANDLLYAKTGGKEGERIKIDNRVYIDGNAVPDVAGTRQRTVSAMSFLANAIVNIVQYPIRKQYAHNYKHTWHHGDYSSRIEKLRKYKFAIDFDVTQFDQSVSRWHIDKWLAGIKPYLSEDVFALYELMHSAPYFHPSVDGTSDGQWFGNPLDATTFTNQSGIFSGAATVSDLGKFFMVWTYFCLIDDHAHDVIEFGVDRILRGEHPLYACLNGGDDNRLQSASKSFLDKVLATVEKDNSSKQPRSTYYAIDIEKAGAFLGDIIIRNDAGELDLVPSLLTYVTNFFIPQGSIGSKFRRFWAVGFIERKKIFGRSPSYDELERAIQAAWRKTNPGKKSIISLVMPHYEEQISELAGIPSELDLMLIAKPERLHYLLDPDEISADVLADFVLSIDKVEMRPYFNKLYNGVILDD